MPVIPFMDGMRIRDTPPAVTEIQSFGMDHRPYTGEVSDSKAGKVFHLARACERIQAISR